MYSLFSLDNCLGGSIIDENLDPEPPANIITEISLFLNVIYYRVNTYQPLSKISYIYFI